MSRKVGASSRERALSEGSGVLTADEAARRMATVPWPDTSGGVDVRTEVDFRRPLKVRGTACSLSPLGHRSPGCYIF